MFFKSFRQVFSFFFFLAKSSKKTKVFFIVSFLPVLMACVIKFSQLWPQRHSGEWTYVFSNIMMAFYLQFLIIILALFFGTSICSEELEGKTLTFLTSRPLPKPSIILGKYAAYTLLITLMTVLSMVICFIVLNINRFLDFSLYSILIKNGSVLFLGLMCYTAFFTVLGTFMKKSILFGLIIGFGWESVIQYFPGSTQKLAIAHYLKSLLPLPQKGRFSSLLFRLEPTSQPMAVLMLFLLTGIFLGLASLIFSLREYVLED